MLDFCGGAFKACFEMYLMFETWQKVAVAVGLFVGMFIILRVVYLIIISFD